MSRALGVKCVRGFRINRQRFLEVLDGPNVIALTPVSQSPVMESIGVFRIVSDGVIKIFDGQSEGA